VEETYWRRFVSLFKDSPENLNAREEFKGIMKKRLGDKPKLLQDILPDFSSHCRRLTPAPGYLEALSKDNVSFTRTPIKRPTKTGIETEDRVH
jgi:cation diffusion facilitator CzcD-associated flavoprotein CzcO